MKWVSIVGITVIVAIMALFEWTKMKKNQKKEKAAFVTLTAAGWLLATLLLFFPDMQGPTQIIDKLFKPLGKMLEK
ncbi:hypothetical protein [Bacillus xiapuensis]|uniref:Uncharacterized protein n=1 Tax=Bacillus xiapuensis TaxID=2014075 RepID=A0ABU6NCI6_9BACI|nr:hypothetical protein [Bacillus xiapuensis]